MPHPTYALLGAAGYIAPRHLDAIAATGGTLVAAADPHDSVGILDKHFPDAAFFAGPDCDERLFGAIARRDLGHVDRVVVCSPNDLHVVHTVSALKVGCDVICEKPLALTTTGIAAIQRAEQESGRQAWTVVQLRHLPRILDLRPRWRSTGTQSRARVTLSYVTRRGPWYAESWKGDPSRSGGLLFNLGIHFLDLLTWCFGPLESWDTLLAEPHRKRGTFRLASADVEWFLSSDARDLDNGDVAQRRMTVNGAEVNLDPNFVAGTHTVVYQWINSGNGFGPADVLPGIEAAYQIGSQVSGAPQRVPERDVPAATARASAD